MQSLLQYRRIGTASQAQLEKEKEGTQAPASFETPIANDGEFEGILGGDQRSHTDGAAHMRSPDRDEEDLSPSPNETGEGDQVFVVGWAGSDDPLMPHNWPLARRVGVTLQVSLLGVILTGASGIDAVVLPQAAEELGVSQVAESLATGKQSRVSLFEP